MTTTTTFATEYSDEGFWSKLAKFSLAAGRDLVSLALQLYYTLQSPVTPAWAKAVIVCALGYFISPIDAIPDFIPVVGYADDLGVLIAAVGTVASHITPGIKTTAEETLRRWFD
jgi:uncharacterized membrane protein YkvA (DUF1232 family)